jgi:ribonuclease HI
MDAGTNYHAEFQALLELLHCAKNLNVGSLQVFMDYKLVIEWMNDDTTLIT